MTQSKIHNRKEFKQNRKDLRNQLTPAEATLWTLLKRKGLEGRKFRRQHSVDKYVLDFYCPSERLAVELDGEPHYTDEGMRSDERRKEYLDSKRIRVLRFENDEIFQSAEEVLAEIRKHFRDRM